MKAPKFVVIVAADEVYQEPSEHTIEMGRREFRTFAAAWKFANSREFANEFVAFSKRAAKQFDRPLIEGCITLQGLHCATIEADWYSCSAWTKHWEL